jgi:Protein of unknown function (DUF3089)
VSRVEVSPYRLALFCLAMCVVLVAAIAPAQAAAEDTVWICKPGQADDLCAGTIDGATSPPPGQSSQPLGYTRPADAPVDCFYLYPTQSEQPGPNADLAKDPPIRRVVVQQARMFSSVCDVYAPMYRQVTLSGDQSSHNPSVETAYQSAKAAFEDFLQNHNGDRGFIMLGHSQGSAHTARLIDELVDPDPQLRKRFVGAIAPGANISVPIGQAVGGLFDNVPACTGVGQYRCVIAFSTYNDVPGPTAAFSRLDFGYWIYPEPRPNASQYEVICTNPAVLDGGNGGLLPLVNFDYLIAPPANETAAPWAGQPEYYRAECKRQDGAHWLNLSKVGLEGDTRPDLAAAVASGSNYHVPEVNITEGNLLRIAQLQTGNYEADLAALRAKLKALKKKIAKSKKRLASYTKTVKRLSQEIQRADAGQDRRALERQVKKLRKKAKAERKRIKALKKQLDRVVAQLP